MKSYLKLSLTVFSTLWLMATAKATTLTAEAIINKANIASYYAKDDGRAEARMRIVDANGNTQLRQFVILRRDVEDGGVQDMLVFFSRPTDVKGTVFRVTKRPGEQDDRWLYLPALDLIKRISAGDKRTSFVGSHFFYEDVSGRIPSEDNHQRLADEDGLFVIKGIPKQSDTVEFAYYHAFIDPSHFLPVRMDYYDKQDRLIRKMTVLTTEVIDGVPTATHVKMEQIATGGFTEMQFRNQQFNIGLTPDLFSERSLRQPPQQWINQ